MLAGSLGRPVLEYVKGVLETPSECLKRQGWNQPSFHLVRGMRVTMMSY